MTGAAKAYNSTIVDDNNRQLDCDIVATSRVYDPEAEDVFGYGYFSLQVHVSQRVAVKSFNQTLYLEVVQAIVEAGFDVVGGGQREFRNSLYVNSLFRSIISIKIRRGLATPVEPPSSNPTMSPTTTPSDSPSQKPSISPTIIPSVKPSTAPSEFPSFVLSASPSATPSNSPSFYSSMIPSIRPTEIPSRIPSTSPSREPSTSPSRIPSTSPSRNPTLIHIPDINYNAATEEKSTAIPRNLLLIAGILGASIVFAVMSLVVCLLCYRYRKKDRERYIFPSAVPLSQNNGHLIPGIVELGGDRQSLADTTLGDRTVDGARMRYSSPPLQKALESFDENSLFTTPFPIDEPEQRATAITPQYIQTSLSGHLMTTLEYEERVVFAASESVSDDSSEATEIPLTSKENIEGPTDTILTASLSIPVDIDSGEPQYDDILVTKIAPLDPQPSATSENDDFSCIPSDLDVWSFDFEDFDRGSDFYKGEFPSKSSSLSSSASTRQIKNMPSSRLLGDDKAEVSSVEENLKPIQTFSDGKNKRIANTLALTLENFVDKNGMNDIKNSSSALTSNREKKPSYGIANRKNKDGKLTSSPTSSRESQSSKNTNVSHFSRKTRTGAPTLENLSNGLVNTLTDLFDRMAIPKVTPEGNEVLYSDRTGSNIRSLSGEQNALEFIKSTSDDDSGMSASPWLMETIENTLGPKSINADIASMSGKSQKSYYSKFKVPQSRKNGSEVSDGNRKNESEASYGSSSNSYSRFSSRNIGSIMSAVSSSMSTDILAQKQPEEISFVKTSRYTLEDGIKRLEMQLAALDQKDNDDTTSSVTMSSITGGSFSSISARSRIGRNRKRVLVIVPPGKLGVILADQHDGNGTVINSIKKGSPVTGILKPGDRLVAVDEMTVNEMSCSQITSLIASRSDRERRFTVMTTVANQNKTT